ncbi:MAG: hypothetical protein ACTS73_08610 [Arsenophonus sp. NEOnobi-MAG3]
MPTDPVSASLSMNIKELVVVKDNYQKSEINCGKNFLMIYTSTLLKRVFHTYYRRLYH